jgi:hypothetical protein
MPNPYTSAYICILDREGKTCLHRNVKASPEAFLKAIEPYREDIVVAGAKKRDSGE